MANFCIAFGWTFQGIRHGKSPSSPGRSEGHLSLDGCWWHHEGGSLRLSDSWRDLLEICGRKSGKTGMKTGESLGFLSIMMYRMGISRLYYGIYVYMYKYVVYTVHITRIYSIPQHPMTIVGGRKSFEVCNSRSGHSVVDAIIIYYWLVVWNIFYFPLYWECHHPNWLSYFSEGLKPPTR